MPKYCDEDFSYALLSLHVITVYGTVGKFNEISNENQFKRFFWNYDNHANRKNEIVEFHVAEFNGRNREPNLWILL